MMSYFFFALHFSFFYPVAIKINTSKKNGEAHHSPPFHIFAPLYPVGIMSGVRRPASPNEPRLDRMAC